jgi:hypothetical protein
LLSLKAQENVVSACDPASTPNKKMASVKPVHTLILDAGPIIKNIPAISSLLAQSEALISKETFIALNFTVLLAIRF